MEIIGSLFNLLGDWFTKPLTRAWILGEAVFFVFFCWSYLRPIYDATSAISKMIAEVVGFQGGLAGGASASAKERFDGFREKLKNSTDFKPSGDEAAGRRNFSPVAQLRSQAAQFMTAWESSSVETDQGPRSLHTPDNYLNSASLLPQGRNLGSGTYVAGFMTSLGILGTFLGLALGVFELSPTMAAQDSKLMSAGVAQLMMSMGTAFGSSVFGIFFALVWIGMERTVSRAYFRTEGELHQRFEDLFPSFDEAELARDEMRLARKQIDAIQSISSDLSSKVTAGFKQVVQENLVPTLERVNTSIETFGTETTQAQFDALGKMMEDFQTGLGERLKQQADTLEGSINGLVEGVSELLSRIKGVYEEVERTAATQVRAVELISESASKFSESLEAIGVLHGKLEETAASSAKTGQLLAEVQAEAVSLHGELRDAVTPLAEVTAKLGVALGEMQAKILDSSQSLQGTLEKFEGSMQGSMDEMQRKIVAGVGESLEAVQAALHATSEELGEAISTGVGEAMTDLNHKLVDALNRLEKAASQLDSNTAASLKAASEATEQLSEVLSDSIDSLGIASARLGEKVKDSVGEVAKAGESFRESVMGSMGALETQLSTSVTGTFTQFDDNLGKVAAHLSGTVAETSDTLEELQTFLARVPTQLEKPLAELRDQLDQVLLRSAPTSTDKIR